MKKQSQLSPDVMGTNPSMTSGYDVMSMFGIGENKANFGQFDTPISPEVLRKIEKSPKSTLGIAA